MTNSNMNTQTQEALKMAIETLEGTPEGYSEFRALQACKEALESQEQYSLRWANAVIDAYKDGYEAHRVESQKQEPVAYILRNEYNEYRLEPLDNLKITDFPIEVEVKLYTHPAPAKEHIKMLNDNMIDVAINNSIQSGKKTFMDVCKDILIAHGVEK